MELNEIRKKIDLIDFEILKLLRSRMELALQSKKFKCEISDSKRENKIIEDLRKYSKNIIKLGIYERIFDEIISESKRLQEQDLKLIGFQGEHGAYGEAAARKFNSDLVCIPYSKFADVFNGVKSGQFDFGIVPVENSLEGAITQVNELLVETDLTIIGEIKLPIHHCLLTLPETDYREIRLVYSHPQALAQCRNFLIRNKLEPRPFYDTAGAAEMLSNNRPKAAAAIASKLCEELYHLEIIKEDIEDYESNSTRFVILAKKKSQEQGNKCSIIFSVKHEAGTLYKVLQLFSEADINLTRIASMPIRNDPGNYTFFLDFQGSNIDKKVLKVLKQVKQKTSMYKFLGCYKEWRSS